METVKRSMVARGSWGDEYRVQNFLWAVKTFWMTLQWWIHVIISISTQGLNPCLLNCRQILYHQSHQGRLYVIILLSKCMECTTLFTSLKWTLRRTGHLGDYNVSMQFIFSFLKKVTLCSYWLYMQGDGVHGRISVLSYQICCIPKTIEKNGFKKINIQGMFLVKLLFHFYVYTLYMASLVAQWEGICLPSRRHYFHPWVGKIPSRRKQQPTIVFLPGKSHGQRSLASYIPLGCKRVGHDLSTKQQQRIMHVCLLNRDGK